MQPVPIVFFVQVMAGIVGCIMAMPSSSGIRPPESWIDDPSKGWRIFNRTMLFLIANMLSLFATISLLESVLDDPVKRMLDFGPDMMDALLMLVTPLPIAWLFYLALIALNRGWNRFLNWEPKNQHRKW